MVVAIRLLQAQETATSEFAEKLRVVEETLVPGASVALVARAHGVNANQVFGWRKLHLTGKLIEKRSKAVTATAPRLLPVNVSDAGQQLGAAAADATMASAPVLCNTYCPLRLDSHSVFQGTGSSRRLRRCFCAARGAGVSAPMIALPANTRIWIAAGVTDMRRGFTGLSALVQTALEQDPLSGHVFAFRGRRGDLIKLLWFDGDGLCLFAKRLERGRFVWPKAESGTVSLTRAQLSMLCEGIDWRRPVRTAESLMAI